METFTELESRAKTMVDKVMARRREGREGILDYIRVNPEEFPFVEADESKYRGMFECEKCNQTTTVCKHNPFLNGTIRRVYSSPVVQEQVEVQPKGNFEISSGVTQRRKRQKRIFSKEQLQEFVDAYVAGKTLQEVADEFDVPQNYVYNAVKAAKATRPKGTKLKPRTPRKAVVASEEQTTQFVTAYLEGKSVKEVADQFGAAVELVKATIKASGNMRSKAEALAVSTKPRGKQRTTLVVTPELLKEAVAKGANAGKMVQIAKEMNLNAQELSKAMKKAGYQVTKKKSQEGVA